MLYRFVSCFVFVYLEVDTCIYLCSLDLCLRVGCFGFCLGFVVLGNVLVLFGLFVGCLTACGV